MQINGVSLEDYLEEQRIAEYNQRFKEHCILCDVTGIWLALTRDWKHHICKQCEPLDPTPKRDVDVAWHLDQIAKHHTDRPRSCEGDLYLYHNCFNLEQQNLINIPKWILEATGKKQEEPRPGQLELFG